MTHTLTAYFSLSYFYTALFTNDTTMFQTLILTAQAFVIIDWSENASTKQAVTLWFERTIIAGFRLFNFTR